MLRLIFPVSLFFLFCVTSVALWSDTKTENLINEIPQVIISKNNFTIPLKNKSQSYFDASAQMTLHEVHHKGGFTNVNPDKVHAYSPEEIYWYRFLLTNRTKQNVDLIFKSNNRNIFSASVYQTVPENFKEKSGYLIKKQSFGDYQNFSERSIKSRKYNLHLNIPAESTQLIYVKWQDQGQAVFEPELQDLHTFFKHQMLVQAVNFLTLGFVLGVLIYNLSIYYQTRDKIYLSFIGYLLSFVVFLELHAGSFSILWGDWLAVDLRPVLIFTAIFILLLSTTNFTAYILKIESREPEKHYYLKVLQVFLFIFAIFSLLLPFAAVEYLIYFSSLSVVGVCVFSGYLIYTKYRDAVARTFLISFAPLALSVFVVNMVYSLELQVFPLMNELLRIAFCFNVIVLSNALSDQIRSMNERQKFFEAKLLAARANEASKSQFFGKVGHEIRTPLNGIVGITDLLKDSDLNVQQSRYVDLLRTSSKSLMRLVDNIVDFSRADSGQMELKESVFSLESLLLEIDHYMQFETLNSGVAFYIEVDESLSKSYFGDENCIRQILFNFLSNAFKFTQEGHVKLSVKSLSANVKWPNKRGVRFVVQDTGIGIPHAQVESIFEDFTQVYTSTNSSYRGAGLGLAICKELSLLLGGEIHLSSREGVGSSFSLDVPLKMLVDAYEDESFRLVRNNFLSSRALLIIDSQKEAGEALCDMSTAWGMKCDVEHTLADALLNVRRASDVSMKVDLLLVDGHCLDSQEGGNHFLYALSRHSATSGSLILILASEGVLQNQDKLEGMSDVILIQRQSFLRTYEAIFELMLNLDIRGLSSYKPMGLHKDSD